MHKITTLFFLFITFLINGQDSIVVTTKSSENNPINNVLAINQKNKTFNYSNKIGETKIFYINKNEIINFEIPGYENLELSVDDIIKRNKTLILNPKFEILSEVLVKAKSMPKYDSSFKYKNIDKYYTDILGSNATFLSFYKHKICDACSLSALAFFIKSNSASNLKEYKVKPLIYKKTKDTMVRLFENYDLLMISDDEEKILIDLSKLALKLKKNEGYYIGFKLINSHIHSGKLKVRALNFKKSHSLLKKSPVDDWFILDNDKNGYTLDFELYFKHLQ